MRVAIFVDGDNVSAIHAERIRSIGESHGSVDLVRVYGNASVNSGWHGAIGYRLIHSGTGKNATDMLLAIDAMEIVHRGNFAIFVLASSDGDFTHLAQRLRERGVTVIGVGEVKAPEAFRSVCSVFESLTPKPAVAAKLNGAGSPKLPTDVDRKVRDMIAANSKNGEGIRITALSPQMHQKHGTKISTYPEKTWRGYLKARPHLYELDPPGQEANVRFKPEGFKQRT